MPVITLDAPARSFQTATSGERAVRSFLFLATFLLTWMTVSPFPDLSDPKLLDPIGDGNFLNQALTTLLTLALAAFVLTRNPGMLLKALSPILAVTLIWFAFSAAFSPNPGLAARRLVLATFIIFQAVAFVLLPLGRDHFSRLLAAGSLIVLALCYFGVLFLPQLSIHQLSDVAEPDLAGNWRGFLSHKNGAGAGMAVLIFIGIFVVRTYDRLVGSLIIALAAIFLIFTESKSPLRLLPLVLTASFAIMWLRQPSMKIAAAAALPLAICLLTIGSVTLEPIQQVVGALLSDPTFTGREEIWRFATDHISQRPVLGFGFQAFWGTSALLSDWSYFDSWGYRASDAHNGYLNIAVMTGIVGLVLSMLLIFGQTIADYIRTPLKAVDPALTMLFLQLWLFGLCLSGFESELFNGGSIVWFMTVVSMIGLRYQATARLAR
jgi:O-antigen ligase